MSTCLSCPSRIVERKDSGVNVIETGTRSSHHKDKARPRPTMQAKQNWSHKQGQELRDEQG